LISTAIKAGEWKNKIISNLRDLKKVLPNTLNKYLTGFKVKASQLIYNSEVSA
jgi:hypothetical protein